MYKWKGVIQLNKYNSRKFIVAVLTAVSILLAKVTGVELSDADIACLAGVAVAYLGGQSYVDGQSSK